MNFAVEIQNQNVEAPEVLVKFGDREAKDAGVRVLDWIKEHPEEVGYDDPLLKDMVEHTGELDSKIEEIENQLRESGEQDSVVLEGKIGQAVLHAVEMTAESEDAPIGAQVMAIRLVKTVEDTKEFKPEESPFLMSGNLDARRKLNAKVAKERHDAMIDARRDANLARLTHTLQNDGLRAESQPEPIWVDQNGHALEEGEYLSLRTGEETYEVIKALKMYKENEKKQGYAEPETKAVNQNIEDGNLAFDLKGEEAHLARKALNMVAEGMLTEEGMADKHNAAVRDIASKIVRTWAQGPKELAQVTIEPHEDVYVTDTKYALKPKASKPKLRLVESKDAPDSQDQTPEVSQSNANRLSGRPLQEAARSKPVAAARRNEAMPFM